MTNKTTYISVSEMALCATNEGDIYEANMALARYCREMRSLPGFTTDRSRKALAMWRDHVRDVVVPCLTGPRGGYRGQELAYHPDLCATELASYYRDLVGEA